jgi:hypothetical protein
LRCANIHELHPPTPTLPSSGSIVHFFDLRVAGEGRVFSCGDADVRSGSEQPPLIPPTITSVAFHAEDSYILFGGTAAGSVIAWDMRRQGATGDISEALLDQHNGPILSLAMGGLASRGLDLFSAGDDGVVRRVPLRSSDQHAAIFSAGAGEVDARAAAGVSVFAYDGEDVVVSDVGVTGCAWLTSPQQRNFGRGDGVLVASGASGALDWVTLLGR